MTVMSGASLKPLKSLKPLRSVPLASLRSETEGRQITEIENLGWRVTHRPEPSNRYWAATRTTRHHQRSRDDDEIHVQAESSYDLGILLDRVRARRPYEPPKPKFRQPQFKPQSKPQNELDPQPRWTPVATPNDSVQEIQ